MNCSKNKIIWFDYIEGRLDDKTVQWIDNHLSECEVCKTGLAIAKASYAEIKSQRKAVPVENLTDNVLNALSDKNETKIISMGVTYYIQRIAAVLIISIGVLLGVILGSNVYDAQKYISSEENDFWSEELYMNTSNTLADIESQIFNED